METKHCGEVANKIILFKRLIREKGEKSGRREKQPQKLGRREKNREKNREKRNLTVRSSPLLSQHGRSCGEFRHCFTRCTNPKLVAMM